MNTRDKVPLLIRNNSSSLTTTTTTTSSSSPLGTINLDENNNNNFIGASLTRDRFHCLKDKKRVGQRSSEKPHTHKIACDLKCEYTKLLRRTSSLVPNGSSICKELNSETNTRNHNKFKLLQDNVDLQMCKCELEHNSLIAKLMNHRFMRRWKHIKLVLEDTKLIINYRNDCTSKLVIHYDSIKDLNLLNKWESHDKLSVRVEIMDFFYLFQTNNVYLRDQLYYSIMWKRNKFIFKHTLEQTTKPDKMLKEIKTIVDMSKQMPLDDDDIDRFPLDLITEKLTHHQLDVSFHEDYLSTIRPLLDKTIPSQEVCDFFSTHCKQSPRNKFIIEMFTPLVERMLKHVGDFGRYPRLRIFLRDYINAKLKLPSGLYDVISFVQTIHGPPIQCPFPRVLQNFLGVILNSISMIYESRKFENQIIANEEVLQLECYAKILLKMCEYDDWRLHLSSILQSIPFPDDFFKEKQFFDIMKEIVSLLAKDIRCEVHMTLIGLHEGKQGWIDVFSRSEDDLIVFEIIIKSLMTCCCRKKKFLLSVNKFLSQFELMALRENQVAIETLCAMLELESIENQELKVELIATLESTGLGRAHYAKVCNTQIALKEIQQKGGPVKLTLPNRSTDSDLATLLSSGHFGNLECLSLAFTNVTSDCAKHLIKLPALKSLNLWSTQFGDLGLELICDHLPNLESLNLCETPVTDKVLANLTSLKRLIYLNLNSTSLSALTYETLKENLPLLRECDIRYTDAW